MYLPAQHLSTTFTVAKLEKDAFRGGEREFLDWETLCVVLTHSMRK